MLSVYLLPDFTTGTKNTIFCQKDEIQSGKKPYKILHYSVRLGLILVRLTMWSCLEIRMQDEVTYKDG
jgi:hypothetical protein